MLQRFFSLRERYKSELEPNEQEEKEGVTSLLKKEKFYSTCLNSLRDYEPKDECRSQAIAFTLDKTKESLSSLDEVVLYVKNRSGEIKEVKETFPLREVLALVWRAVNDDSRYPSSFAVSGEAAAARAIRLDKDREQRLLTFFNTLHRLKTNQRCHHGVRHEWVSSLNGSEGIHLIENIKGTLLAFIKEEFSKLFWRDYDTWMTKPGCKAAFFEWMQNQDPSGIFSLVDPGHRILGDKVEKFLLSHGTQLPRAEVMKLYEKSFEAITFFTDDRLEHAAFDMASRLLNNVAIDGEKERNAALLFMQEWITVHDIRSADYKKTIAQFYLNLQTFDNLKKFDTLLRAVGKYEEYAALREECHAYFGYFKVPFSPIPHVMTESLILKRGTFQSALELIKEDKLYHKIENFFAEWYGSINDRSKLYYLLLNEETRQKIVFKNDAELQSLLKKETTTESKESKEEKKEEVSVVLNFSPYEINRIFLTAIWIDPEKWTPFFTSTLCMVFEFVQRTFDKPESRAAQSLRRSSYPKQLEDQIHYLICSKKNLLEEKKLERPADMILFPSQAKQFWEWANILAYLLPYEREKIAMSYLLSIFNATFNELKMSPAKNFILRLTLNFLPPTIHASFFARIDPKLLQECIQNELHFKWILLKLENPLLLINALSADDLRSCMMPYTLAEISRSYSREFFDALLNKLETSRLKTILNVSFYRFSFYFKHTPFVKLVTLFDCVGEYLLSDPQSLFALLEDTTIVWTVFTQWAERNPASIRLLITDLCAFFEELDLHDDSKQPMVVERMIQILTQLDRDYLRSLVPSSRELLRLTTYLSSENQISIAMTLVNCLGIEYLNKILTKEDFCDLLIHLKQTDNPAFIRSLGLDSLAIEGVLNTPVRLSQKAYLGASRGTLENAREALLTPLATRYDAMLLLHRYMKMEEEYRSVGFVRRMEVGKEILTYLVCGGAVPDVEGLCAPLADPSRRACLFPIKLPEELSLLKEVAHKVVNFAKLHHKEWFPVLHSAAAAAVPADVFITSGVGKVRREQMDFSFRM